MYIHIYIVPLKCVKIWPAVVLLTQSNPVVATSIYAKFRLERQIFCGINRFLTVTITLCSSVTTTFVSRHKIFSPFHSVIINFDCTFSVTKYCI
jgi:hypothetical protein